MPKEFRLLLPAPPSPDTYPSNKALVEASLLTIRDGLSTFPRDNYPGKEITTDEFNTCMRGRSFMKLGIVPVMNGFVLQKVTKEFLADHSHRLKVPTDESPVDYHSESFNVDQQAISGKPVILKGIDEISRTPRAVIAILSFERDILYSAINQWEGLQRISSRVTRC